MRERDEPVRQMRAPSADRALQEIGGALGRCVGERDEDEGLRAASQQCDDEREHDPDGAPASDARQPDEDVVQRADAVLEDPVLELVIQTGASCFVLSISCCRSNGLPMKPCAPRLAACSSAWSSILPLNMTTGIAPAP